MAMNDIQRIAVVIVNWNKKDDILRLLAELQKATGPGFDVIVVDNASSDGSVEVISEKFPKVTLIVNKVNTGGTGGFNRGVSYVVAQNKYKYIWLLDNDSKIEKDTLCELYYIMERDPKIGLAGSRIVDINNRKITVETGGNFRWDITGVLPVNRNTTADLSETVDVDYVAICSALVRVESLKRVGLMDSRLFLLWDDMDWGLCFKEHGYKVVAVPKSIVHHGSFTERSRGEATDYYYNIRNAYLVYSKHTKFLKRVVIFYRTVKHNIRTYIFFSNNYRKRASKLMLKAFKDYLKNRWGQLIENRDYEKTDNNTYRFISDSKNKNRNKILFPVSGTSFYDSQRMLERLRIIYPEAEVTILVNIDRAVYYNNYKTYKLNKKKIKSLIYLCETFIKLRNEKFDCVAAVTPSPFIYVANQALFLHQNDQMISLHHTGPAQFMKLCLMLCWGEVLALILLPILMLKSLQYTTNTATKESRLALNSGFGRDDRENAQPDTFIPSESYSNSQKYLPF